MAAMGAAASPQAFNLAPGDPVQPIQQGAAPFPPNPANNPLGPAQQFPPFQQHGFVSGLAAQPIPHPTNMPPDQRMRDLDAMGRIQQMQPQPVNHPGQPHGVLPYPHAPVNFDRAIPPALGPPHVHAPFPQHRAMQNHTPFLDHHIRLGLPGDLGPSPRGINPHLAPLRIVAGPPPGLHPGAEPPPMVPMDRVMSPRPMHGSLVPQVDIMTAPVHFDSPVRFPGHPLAGEFSRELVLINRPYGYPEFEKPYPGMQGDLQILLTSQMNAMATIDPKHIIDILAQRTPPEMAALRNAFRAHMGTNIDYVLATTLLYELSPEVKIPYTGLALGNPNFDIYLIENARQFNLEEILIDIFVGRTPRDLMLLDQQYQKLHPGSGLATAVEDVSDSNALSIALRVITESVRFDPLQPVNLHLVQRDIEELIRIRESGIPDPAHLFAILFRRTEEHLHQIIARWPIYRRREMDRDFREAYGFSEKTRAITVHFLRSLRDPLYRDCMLLKDAFKKRDPTLLAVRITRIHWYPEYWVKVKAAYMGYCGESLIGRLNGFKGMFRDLVVTMAQVPV